MKPQLPTSPPTTPTPPSLPRTCRARTCVRAAARRSTPPRRSSRGATPGIKPASAVPNVARGWSPPRWPTKTERSTAKHATGRTLAPRDLGSARGPVLWRTPSEEASAPSTPAPQHPSTPAPQHPAPSTQHPLRGALCR